MIHIAQLNVSEITQSSPCYSCPRSLSCRVVLVIVEKSSPFFFLSFFLSFFFLFGKLGTPLVEHWSQYSTICCLLYYYADVRSNMVTQSFLFIFHFWLLVLLLLLLVLLVLFSSLFFFGRGLLVPRYDQLVKLQEGDDAVPEAAVIWAMRAAAKKLTFEPILSDPRVLIEIGGPATTTAMLAVRTTHSTSQYGTLARARFTVTLSAHATCVVLSRSGNGTYLPTCRYTRLFTVTALAHVPSVVLFLCFVC